MQIGFYFSYESYHKLFTKLREYDKIVDVKKWEIYFGKSRNKCRRKKEFNKVKI